MSGAMWVPLCLPQERMPLGSCVLVVDGPRGRSLNMLYYFIFHAGLTAIRSCVLLLNLSFLLCVQDWDIFQNSNLYNVDSETLVVPLPLRTLWLHFFIWFLCFWKGSGINILLFTKWDLRQFIVQPPTFLKMPFFSLRDAFMLVYISLLCSFEL